jgi:site-specific DNA-methyltransferase (adenine-specific)
MATKKNTANADQWRNRIVGEGMVAAVDLVPHPQNWRKHPASQGTVLAQTLDGVGWVQRVIVNRRTGRMLDGHLRAELARKQGEQTPVPVVYVDLSEDEERTVLATLDPIAGMAVADEATLAGLVRSIEDADLRSVAGTIAQTLNVDVDGKGEAGKDTEAQIDRAEELRQKWGVEPGQLWQLGEHRLICGDCTDAAVVMRVTGGETISGLVSDPPYSSGGFTRGDRQASTGTKYQYNADDTNVKYLDFAGDNKDQRSWITWCHLWLSIWLKTCREGTVLALFIDWRQLPALTDAVQSAGWLWRGVAVWDKTEAARPLYGRFKPQTEFVVWGSAGPLPLNDGSPTYPGVIRQMVEASSKMHLTQKPIQVGEWSLSMTKPGDIVADPFLGSGTTLIACENLGRRCRAVEIAPGYVAVALERWHVHTGKTPVLLDE